MFEPTMLEPKPPPPSPCIIAGLLYSCIYEYDAVVRYEYTYGK